MFKAHKNTKHNTVHSIVNINTSYTLKAQNVISVSCKLEYSLQKRISRN